jgi:hypothetical protein
MTQPVADPAGHGGAICRKLIAGEAIYEHRFFELFQVEDFEARLSGRLRLEPRPVSGAFDRIHGIENPAFDRADIAVERLFHREGYDPVRDAVEVDGHLDRLFFARCLLIAAGWPSALPIRALLT